MKATKETMERKSAEAQHLTVYSHYSVCLVLLGRGTWGEALSPSRHLRATLVAAPFFFPHLVTIVKITRVPTSPSNQFHRPQHEPAGWTQARWTPAQATCHRRTLSVFRRATIVMLHAHEHHHTPEHRVTAWTQRWRGQMPCLHHSSCSHRRLSFRCCPTARRSVAVAASRAHLKKEVGFYKIANRATYCRGASWPRETTARTCSTHNNKHTQKHN
jgi:hypothetical protein